MKTNTLLGIVRFIENEFINVIIKIIFISMVIVSSSQLMAEEPIFVMETLEQNTLLNFLDSIERDISSENLEKISEIASNKGISPNEAIRESFTESLWELARASIHYPESSALRPLYNRLIAKASTFVGAHDQAFDQLMIADEMIGNIYGSPDPVSIELAERYSKIYDDLSTSILNKWNENSTKDDSSEIILAALGAADRGLFQSAIQRHQSNRSQMKSNVDPMPGAMYIPQRFQSLNGDIAALAYEAERSKVFAAVGGTSIIYYQQLEHSLRAWVFYSGQGFEVFNLPATKKQMDTLSQKIRQTMINGIAGVPGTKSKLQKTLSKVSELVLPPIKDVFESESPEILIIADGSLNLIPFDALPLEDGEPLIKKAAIRTAPSLAFLKLQLQYLQFGTIKELMDNNRQDQFSDEVGTYELIQRRKHDRVALVFNPVTAKNGPVFGNLDKGENEVPVSFVKTADVYRGVDASESALVEALSDSKIIHIVAHANSLLGLDAWQSSYIALSPTDSSNGFLTASEILSLPQFYTELVVLSACDSGSGSISSSEGVLALSTSLLERGAQSVIASLWPVSDNIPKLIFPKFYESWLSPEFVAKESKAQALRSAKLQLIANGLEPWDWAAFQVHGTR